MEAITITTNTQITGTTFNPGYIEQFVQWIDRGQRTTQTYLTNLKQFLAWMRYSGITQPIRDDVISYRDWLSSEHYAIIATPDGWQFRTDSAGNRIQIICKPYTVKQYIQSVKQFFKWLTDFGYYPNIASNVHTPKINTTIHKKDALTPSEVLTVEESITSRAKIRLADASDHYKDRDGRIQRSTEQSKRLLAMYLLATNAGLRTVEISRANVKDIEQKSGTTYIYIWGKGCSEPEQKKILAPEVAEAITDYLKSRKDKPSGSSPLFVGTSNRRSQKSGSRIAPNTISTMLKRALQDAGFNSERITAHSLRHSTGTAIMAMTSDLFATQKYMRHADPKTTEIYIHETEAEEQKSAALAQGLYDLFHGKTDAKNNS